MVRLYVSKDEKLTVGANELLTDNKSMWTLQSFTRMLLFNVHLKAG